MLLSPICVRRTCSGVSSFILCHHSFFSIRQAWGSSLFAIFPCTPKFLYLHLRALTLATPPTRSSRCHSRLCMAGMVTPGRSQLKCPLLREVVPEFPGCKDGLILLCPLLDFFHPTLSPTLSWVFTCLLSVSPVIQQTMQGWGPCLSYPLPCPQHLAQESRKPAGARSMNE